MRKYSKRDLSGIWRGVENKDQTHTVYWKDERGVQQITNYMTIRDAKYAKKFLKEKGIENVVIKTRFKGKTYTIED